MKFALITEGPSEHRIIKHIIAKYFRDQEPVINQIQPKIVDGTQKTTGGWNEVLKYCERDELNDIFIENDYLIIQIDTDQSQTKPFSISHIKPDNSLKTVDELFTDVVGKLRGLIKLKIWNANSDKIFFAICIHTIECWLLPLVCTNERRTGIRNCVSILNTELRRQNIRPISVGDKNNQNSINTYATIMSNWRRKREIIASAQHNTAFKKFVDSLEAIEDPPE